MDNMTPSLILPQNDGVVHQISSSPSAKNCKSLLYIFEDTNSGVDFLLNIINHINPHTNSRYYIGNGCGKASRRLKSFLEGRPLDSEIDRISYKNVSAIVFIHDMCSAGIAYNDAIKSAIYRGIDLTWDDLP